MRPSRGSPATTAPAGHGCQLPCFDYFYDYIRDPKVSDRHPWPFRPDSYLLISAGMDGLYGTEDDIRNFGQ